ncbi:MAG: hypothetical protein P8Y14_28680, partial [Anaerolineales bacterium]
MQRKANILFATLLIASLVLAACGGNSTPTQQPATEQPAGGQPATAEPTEGAMMLSGELLGAGASFPAPIYLEWIAEYTSNVQPGVSINYQSIGSGGG